MVPITLKKEGRDMFGFIKTILSKSKKPREEPIDRTKVRTFYEGEVICGDFNLNDHKIYPYHNLFPHGMGKITYVVEGRVVEQYEGEFEAGQYHGKGTRIDRYGQIFEGIYEEGFIKE
jgi:hypothetical protein